MSLVIWIYAISALASAIAALFAWIAKLRWAKEYAAAKDETIKAKQAEIERLQREVQSIREITNDIIKTKDAQIQFLTDLTPMKVREYFMSMRNQLEEYIEHLKQQAVTSRIDERTKAAKATDELMDEMVEAYGLMLENLSEQLREMEAQYSDLLTSADDKKTNEDR